MAEGNNGCVYDLLLYAAWYYLQNIIQKRSDVPLRRLMDKLMHERNTLNDLRMLIP